MNALHAAFNDEYGAMSPKRVPSWAPSEKERDERIRHAERLVGLTMSGVRYFDIDYEVLRSGITPAGPRVVTEPEEWASPSWRFEQCHSLDYGLEIETTSGRVFSITWDPPGTMEGVGLREEPLVGPAIVPDAAIAVWDVSERSEWQHHMGRVVSGLTMHYRPWGSSDAWWCPRISITIDGTPIDILLAECRAAPTGIAPSANDIVVLFDPTTLPPWS